MADVCRIRVAVLGHEPFAAERNEGVSACVRKEGGKHSYFLEGGGGKGAKLSKEHTVSSCRGVPCRRIWPGGAPAGSEWTLGR